MVESASESGWQPSRPLLAAGGALALGLLAERLFFARPWGVSFPLWMAVVCLFLLGFAWYEKRLPATSGLLLLLPIVGLSSMLVFRLEPLTTFLGVVLPTLLLAVWVQAFRSGNWLQWGWLDFLTATVWVPLESLVRPWPTMAAAQSQMAGEAPARARWLAIVRGLLLALPILIVFTALFAAADLVFGDLVELAFSWLDLETFFEILARVVFGLVVALVCLGGAVVALRRQKSGSLVREGEPLVRPFLGGTETSIVLGGVDLLFLLFVLVQIGYFFGGEANIDAAGYTYSEYARRGFGEMVFAAFLSLGLILTLSTIAKANGERRSGLFSGLSLALVGFNGVVLMSALQRLLLYESAYGFTRARTYTHIFIFWLGFLFAVFAALLLFDRLRAIAPAAVLAAIGFAATLGILNVDRFIVERNFEHQQQIGRLDVYYLSTLTDDAVPTIVSHLAEVPEDVAPRLFARLSCRQFQLENKLADDTWPSFRLPHQRASIALQSISDQLAEYPVDEEGEGYGTITLDEDNIEYCSPFPF